MVDVAVYVEFKAKALIKELSENFDIRKCGDLYQTLGDLLKLTDAPLQDQDADVIPTLSENAKEPPPQEGSEGTEAVLKTRRKTDNHRPHFG